MYEAARDFVHTVKHETVAEHPNRHQQRPGGARKKHKKQGLGVVEEEHAARVTWVGILGR